MNIPLLHRMGDAEATRILDIEKTRGALTAVEQRNAVDMAHIAFEHPAAIMHDGDRRPVSSLLVLQQLSGTARDLTLQQRIAETQKFVMDASTAR